MNIINTSLLFFFDNLLHSDVYHNTEEKIRRYFIVTLNQIHHILKDPIIFKYRPLLVSRT